MIRDIVAVDGKGGMAKAAKPHGSYQKTLRIFTNRANGLAATCSLGAAPTRL